MNTTMFLLLLGYCVALFGFSYWLSRRETSEGFLIGGRNRPAWQVAFSKYAGSVGAGWLIAYAGFAYDFGLGLVVIVVGGFLGITLYAFWAVPRVRAQIAEEGYTQGDFVLAQTKSMFSKKSYSSLVLYSHSLRY